jgi:hypothetical protein
MNLDAGSRGIRLREPYGFVGGIETGDVPALHGEEHRVAALAHSEIQRLAGLAIENRACQQRVRRLDEDGVVAAVDLVP